MTIKKTDEPPASVQRKLQMIREKNKKAPANAKLTRIEKLPPNIRHILQIMRGEVEKPKRERIKPIDFYSLEADEVFPNSPDLQRYFNIKKREEMERREFKRSVRNRLNKE
ncbi:hypothetical protein [Bacillus bombysepticus]|uniref:hypothetical protein n=1 Tax=Bacillus bombysepticus TaxID=658666 RepID=UPI0030185250